MFSIALPVLDIVNVCLEDWPIITSPNAILVLGSEMSGAAAVPLPDTDTVTVGSSGSLLVTVMAPVLAPAEVGVNVTVTPLLLPAATEKEVGDTVN